MTDLPRLYSDLLSTVEMFLRGKANQAQLVDAVKTGRAALAETKRDAEFIAEAERQDREAEILQARRNAEAALDADRERHLKQLDESEKQ